MPCFIPSYVSRDPSLSSETYQCKRGVNQLFSQSSHTFNPSAYSDDELGYHSERGIFPVAIHCVVDDCATAATAADEIKQSHTTICVVDHHTDGTFVLRALKQKIYVDGLCYLLQEIYGIENKNINKVHLRAFISWFIIHHIFSHQLMMIQTTMAVNV